MRHGLFVVLLFFSLSAHAADYKKEIDQFFVLFKQGKIEESVSSIYKSNAYVTSVPDQIINVKNQLASLAGLVGKLHYIKEIDTYNVNDVFVHVTYVASYDRQLVRFEFQFFKVSDGWRIYSFSFDDSMDDEIEVLARKAALSKIK